MQIPSYISPGIKANHLAQFSSLHPEMQTLYEQFPLSDQYFLYITAGFRGKNAQNAAFRTGNSNARWGASWHNLSPSLAMDIVPIWADSSRTIEWGTPRTKEVLKSLSSLFPGPRWGGNWHGRKDIYHYQLLDPASPPVGASELGYILDSTGIHVKIGEKE